ncbi:MAG: chaperonin GroEL [Candidatus Shapirobacteria bacterium]|nr:chaperonin GroEL [Candidatus Shapirobacteria bacterium]MDD5073657.1 chaperonin GroEL [Candidatus Shapirobacteria bacterium]MDD5481382.1 chaperonin GroEL [Candidatus Shapirobacteria bacterium]
MAKQIIFGSDARNKILKGAELLSKAVVTTLGPRGRNVAIEKSWGSPQVVHDGVTVAKEVELEDKFENMGAQLVKEAASKTNDNAGDGTTTATLLAYSIIAEGMKNITAGTNPMILRRGLEKGLVAVVAELGKIKKEIKDNSDIEKIATISAGDPDIGQKIAEALNKVGSDGIVTVEESKGLELEIEYKEGMEFDEGYVSPYFVTDSEAMEAEIDEPYIIITDQKISAIADILPSLERIIQTSKNIVIIADDLDGEALATLVVNKLRGTFNILAVKAPGFGDRKKEMLSDIAILTGGTVISEETGRKLDSINIEDCGRADKVWADKENTRIIGGQGKEADIAKRVNQIRQAIEESDSDFDKEKLQERLAKLAGGVAQINVGAATEIELSEKKERVKDAVEATKAAVEEGVIPGGGSSLIFARQVLNNLKTDNEEEAVGVKILYSALEQPARWLAKNAGADAGYVVAKTEEELIKDKSLKGDYGFNALTGEFVNMVRAGIIDPLKVTRLALQNAVSVGIMALTTEAMIVDKPEEKEKATPGAGGMGDMSGMGM